MKVFQRKRVKFTNKTHKQTLLKRRGKSNLESALPRKKAHLTFCKLVDGPPGVPKGRIENSPAIQFACQNSGFI